MMSEILNARITQCPKCKRHWEEPCEQTASIILFNECLSCRRFVLTDQELEQIAATRRAIVRAAAEIGKEMK